jgi:DNA topoisomerase-1
MPPKFYHKKWSKSGTKKGSSQMYEPKVSANTKYLLIVESPSKCRKIEEFLGSEYRCIASMGHLREIKSLADINANKNYEVTYSNIKDKDEHIEKMRIIINAFLPENIFLASDDDREGEAIAWHICKIFDLPIETTPRIIFHEITKSAIQTAIANPTTINTRLVNAQQCRQILDIMVGYNVSPYLWKCLYCSKDKPLSAGRCQTPALRLVYDNYLELANNTLETKYKTSASFFSNNILFSLNHQFREQSDVESFLTKSINYKYSLTIGSPKDTTKSPPKPFNTSKLLQAASSLLNIGPKLTMLYCQQLYQDGYITYMRTDSTKYSKEFLKKAGDYITDKWKTEYIGNLSSIENKNTNDPHEAIRVTYIEQPTITNENNKIISLYKLIWSNTVESCMTAATYKTHDIQISAPLNYNYSYVLDIPVFLGWKIVKSSTVVGKELNPNAILMQLQSIIAAQSPINHNNITSVVVAEHRHSHYTEASLIQKLEDLGIGRPSTFASLIDTILERGYVKVENVDGVTHSCTEFSLADGDCVKKQVIARTFGAEKNKLVIQLLGKVTIDFLVNNFDHLFSYDYTKNMETDLDQIVHPPDGVDKDWRELCNTCISDIKRTSKSPSYFAKLTYRVDDTYNVVFQNGKPILRRTIDKNTYDYKAIRDDIVLDLDKLKNNQYTFAELVNIENDCLGKIDDMDVIIKCGVYGPYVVWNENNISLKELNKSAKDIVLEDVISYINPLRAEDKRDNNIVRTMPTKKDNVVIREIDECTSIRQGKYGAYIFYKPVTAKKPTFYNITKSKLDINNCNIQELRTWIKDTYNLNI